MGDIFKQSSDFYPTQCMDNSVIVEIGNDRGEGSTSYYSELASKYNTKLYAVDVIRDPSYRFNHLLNVEWFIEEGSVWTQEIFPTFNKSISCLYLDNFDYIWDINEISQWIQDQINDYKKRGIIMNNENCEVEHLAQMINLIHYMIPGGIVVCDDTFEHNGCWIGKSGAVVIYLLVNGYKIELKTDTGVILKAPSIKKEK